MTGQLLYPLGSGGLGDVHRPLYPAMWESSYLGNGRAELVPLAATALWRWTGPCSLVAVAGLPLWLAWLLVSGRSRLRAAGVVSEGPARLALCALTAASGLVFAVTPFSVEDVPGTLNQLEGGETPARYALGFLSLASLALVVFLDDVSRLAASRPGARSKPGLLATSLALAAALSFQFVCNVHGNDPEVKYSPILEAFIDDLNVLLVANILCYAWILVIAA